MMEFIFMLTRGNRTVASLLALADQIVPPPSDGNPRSSDRAKVTLAD